MVLQEAESSHKRNQNHYSRDLIASENNLDSGISSSPEDVGSKRIKVSDDQNPQQQTIKFSNLASPLGLKLNKSPSLINLVGTKLTEAKKSSERVKMDSEKLKASNFQAMLLKIGNWERKSKHEGDLIAKCYYAKKKIVWEILYGALKNKVEIQWSDIIGICADIRENQPGVLKVELENPPTFFRELNPQPRKHTIWEQASDFTGGQAPIHRLHLLVFPPGILDKHYEKLLQCDQRLYDLSQRPFPTKSNPFFYPNICSVPTFPTILSAHASNMSPQMTNPVQYVHPTVLDLNAFQNFVAVNEPHGFLNSASPLSVMDFPRMDETERNAMGNQRVMHWSNCVRAQPITIATQGNKTHCNAASLSPMTMTQTQCNSSVLPITAVTPQGHATTLPYQGVHGMSSVHETGLINGNAEIPFGEIENHMLEDTEALPLDETALLEGLRAMNSSFLGVDDLKLDLTTNTNNIDNDIIANQVMNNQENLTLNQFVLNSMDYSGAHMNANMQSSSSQTSQPLNLSEFSLSILDDFAVLDSSQNLHHQWGR